MFEEEPVVHVDLLFAKCDNAMLETNQPKSKINTDDVRERFCLAGAMQSSAEIGNLEPQLAVTNRLQ